MVLGIPGTDFLNNIDIGGTLSGVGKIVVSIVLFGLVALIVGFIMLKRRTKKNYNQRLFFFEEVGESMIPIFETWATELTIPGTNVKVFYSKDKDLYLPRPTIRMGKNAFWYAVRNNRELVNFKMKNLNEEMKEAKLDFDHTDMRYASENLKLLIQRNYRDKATPWWREYKDVIATVIFVVIMGLTLYFLLGKAGDVLNNLSAVADKVGTLIDKANALSGSGVKAA